MNAIWERLKVGFDQLINILPSFLFAAGILLVGYLVARLIERWTDAVLSRLNFNKMAEAGGISEAVGRTGTRLDPIHVIGKLLFWLVMLVVILLASAALGLNSINVMFGTMLSYIPTLFAAVIIVILGMIVGEFVRAIVLASAGGVEGVPTLAKVAKVAVVLIAVFMAMQQMGVAAEIITAAFTATVGAIALAAGLAFGLGNRDLAGEITRRWYEEGRQRRLSRLASQEAKTAGSPTSPPPESENSDP
ncbi:MAG: mechanosensitive ion channel family protein [Gemmatimonadales bacterium]